MSEGPESAAEMRGPDWIAWKAHLVGCADCTARDYCAAGRALLGTEPNDDRYWLLPREQRLAFERFAAIARETRELVRGMFTP